VKKQGHSSFHLRGYHRLDCRLVYCLPIIDDRDGVRRPHTSATPNLITYMACSPKQTGSCLVHNLLFLGDSWGVFAALEDQAVARCVREGFLGKPAQARWAVPRPMPNSFEIAAQERP
jgi:hypothetical protein